MANPVTEVLPPNTSKVASVTSTAATTNLQRTKTQTKASGNANPYFNRPAKLVIKNKGLGNNTGSVVLARVFTKSSAVTAVTDSNATYQIAPGSTVVVPLGEGVLDNDVAPALTNPTLVLAATVAGWTAAGGTFTASGSTALYPATGSLVVPTVPNSVTGAAAVTPLVLTYTGVSGSTFTGVTTVSGSGDIAAGATITGNTYNVNVTTKLAAGDATTNFVTVQFVSDAGGH